MILEREDLKNDKSEQGKSETHTLLESTNLTNDDHDKDKSEKGQIGKGQI